MSNRNEKTVFITGSSSGLGKAAARLFAARGWNVVATMRSPDKEKDLSKFPGITLRALDITDPQQIERAVAETLALGDVDVVFNNAGYGMSGPLEGMTDAQMLRMVNTNLMGPIRVTKAFVPHFRQKRAGLFINTTSIGGLITVPFNSIYHATKWALEGWSESMAFELGQFGIGHQDRGARRNEDRFLHAIARRWPARGLRRARGQGHGRDHRSEANEQLLHTRRHREGRLRSCDGRQGSAALRGRRRREGDVRGASAGRRRGVQAGDQDAVLRLTGWRFTAATSRSSRQSMKERSAG